MVVKDGSDLGGYALFPDQICEDYQHDIFGCCVCVCVCVSSIVDVVVFELVFVLCVFPSIGVSGRGVGNSCKHRNLSEAAEIIHHYRHPELNICTQ